MPIDPRISLSALTQPVNPLESYGNLLTLRNLLQSSQTGKLQQQEAQIRLAELQRQQQEQAAVRTAAGNAYMPEQAPQPTGSAVLSDMLTPGQPAGLDRSKFLGELGQTAPTQALDWQQKFAEQEAKHAQELQALNDKQFTSVKNTTDFISNQIGRLMAVDPQYRPSAYQTLHDQLAQQMPQLTQMLPPQYPGDQWLAQQAAGTQAYQQAVTNEQAARTAKETARHNQATEANTIRGQNLVNARAKDNSANAGADELTPVDSSSGSILAQTGLSLPAFNVLTGNAKNLPRDKATRAKAMKEAQDWANKQGVDISTMAQQYQSMNKVLGGNIERMNNTKIMENELEGTIQNLRGVANDKDLGKLNVANVVKIWGGQQVNDNLAQQYAMHLNQLRNELTAYNAATQGRSGSAITIEDMRDAERTIKNGIAQGSLNGLETAVKNSTAKMSNVMQNSVNAAQKGVWDLFGVGKNFKPKGAVATTGGIEIVRDANGRIVGIK